MTARPMDTDGETERMARLLTVEAKGEADWLAIASGTDRAVTRSMAVIALRRAAMKLEAMK